jgi:hypothetical protein
MATLALTTVGTAFGGPIGGALGGLIGQSIDQGLFGGGMPRGPRLGDLSVQTSSYGSPIPRIYGRMRIAGTVVWATDLKEEEAIEGGGKGSPERLSYRYSVSLAVALSSRPIREVRRIWADGKLIRGAGGEFVVRTTFRVVEGSEDQPADPLIASIETIGRTPAYRGLAMAIFENLELSEFGNRIPLLTFEIEADEAPVSTADVVADASAGLIELGEVRAVVGYAAHGSSIADSIRPLVEHHSLPIAERDGKLRGAVPSDPVELDTRELGCDADGRERPSVERLRTGDSSLPSGQCLQYYDADRDFQAGQMRASSGGGGAIEDRIEVPAVLAAAEAKQWVEQRLARKWQAANKLRLRLPPSRMGLKPGDRIRLPGSARSMTVNSAEIDGMAVVIEAEPGAAEVVGLPADPGRTIPDADEPIGRTELALFELPAIGGLSEAGPKIFAAASNQGRWKPVPVELWLGQQPLTGLALGRRAVLGTATTMLDPRVPLTLDLLSSVTVRLSNPSQMLFNADWDALTAGANLAIIGEELIQFGRAERLEQGLYRLSHLLRGRRGTEWAGAMHCVGERFCLSDTAKLAPVALPAGTTGADLKAVAHGIADVAPLPEVQRVVSGEAMRPPSVCHLHARRDGTSIHLSWVRRSQAGWSWNDGVDVPTDPFPENYLVKVTGPTGEMSFHTDRPEAIFDAVSLSAEPGQIVEVQVRTAGAMALSRPRGISLTL